MSWELVYPAKLRKYSDLTSFFFLKWGVQFLEKVWSFDVLCLQRSLQNITQQMQKIERAAKHHCMHLPKVIHFVGINYF